MIKLKLYLMPQSLGAILSRQDLIPTFCRDQPLLLNLAFYNLLILISHVL